MEKSNRTLAFLSYLVPVIMPLFVIFTQRKDVFARYHAFQSLALIAGAVAVPIVWAIPAWVVAWIPMAGPLLSAASFALVIGAYLTIVYGWVTGMYAALQGRIHPVPLFGGWGERFQV
ncbi:MAG: hypothetical protein R2856_09870 [Caldilineaceae bacterium]